MPKLTLHDLAQQLGAKLVGGDASTVISSLAPLATAVEGQLTFLGDSKYRSQLSSTKASAVILSSEDAAQCPTACLVLDEPAKAFAIIAVQFSRKITQKAGIHISAVVADTATIDKTTSIGPNVVIGERVQIAPGVTILPNTVIGDDVSIGADSTIHANVSIYAGCRIGERVVIHSGAVIGSDGFGNVNSNGQWSRMPQLGSVVIGDDVDIGANTCIDCGALGDTVIGRGARLDNLIQIAHNVEIGDHTAMAAQVGVAGSTKIGKACLFGGKVGVNGHITICDQAMFTASTMISKSIQQPGVYSSGQPAQPTDKWAKTTVCYFKLADMHKRLRIISKYIERLDEDRESQ